MALQRLIGTAIDRIAQSASRSPAYRVILFDLYQDNLADIVLDRYTQVPLDVTPLTMSVNVTQAHDTESNQASFQFAGEQFDWRWLLFTWVKVYEGDNRVDQENWPCVFSGVFRGQPSRNNERGSLRVYNHTAYDRSVFFRSRKHTSGKSWQPFDADPDIGTICREFAINPEWGMGLDPSEVLFGQLGFDIKQKLQIVDVEPMEALTKIMEVADFQPGFNGEGKLVARPVDLDRLPIRIYQTNDLIKSVNLPAQVQNLPQSVTVRGLDFRVTRVDWKSQKIFKVGPITVGMFTPKITTRESFDDEKQFRVAVDGVARSINFQGELLADIFGLDDEFNISITQDGEFHCNIVIEFEGAYIAIGIVTGMLLAYILLKIIGAEIGSANAFTAFLGWVIEASAVVLLALIMQTMRSLGKMDFEVWGEPYEYVYQELEARAILADVDPVTEDNTEIIENHILSTLPEVRDAARRWLRQKVAKLAQRSLTIATDPLLEPNDVLELQEEGETARYYVLQVTHNLQRGSDPTYDVSAFRAK